MQPYFLPYIGAFQMINAVDAYIVYGKINYKNDGWFHRNRMILRNKGEIYFNLSMENASVHKTFNEISVSDAMKWRKKFMKTFEHNYCKTIYYEETRALLDKIIFCKHDSLTEYNYNSLKIICGYLGLGSKLLRNLSLEDEVEEFLQQHEPNDGGYSVNGDIKTLRIIRICELLKADKYYNPIGGISLYDKDVLLRHGIELKFLNSSEITYHQGDNEFIPNLSIIDVISHCGREKTREFLSMYNLV